MISIIIPVYNSGKFVAETIDSVIAQTYTDWECILIDDNSADNSVEIVNTYITKYPGKISLRTNTGKGACAARNLGLSYSKGTYIKFLDSDDALFDNTVLARQIEFYEQNQYDIVYGVEYYYQDEFAESNLIKKRGTPINGPTTFYDNFPITSNFLLSKEKLGSLQWNKELKSGQEFFLLFQCLCKGMAFGFQNIATSKIRVHNSEHRISNKSNEKHIAQMLQLITYMLREIETLHLSDEVFLKQFKKQLLLSSHQAIKLGDTNAVEIIREEIARFKNIGVSNLSLSMIYKVESASPKTSYLMYKIFSRLGLKLQ